MEEENELAQIGKSIWDKMDTFYNNTDVEIEPENENS